MDRIQATNELAFRAAFSGHSGHLRVEPLSSVERTNPVKSLPDYIFPPAFPRETHESIKDHIEEKYLLPRLDPDEFSAEKAGKQWDFDWFEMAKLPLEPSLPQSVVVPTWEVPFRRKRKGLVEGMWEPNSAQVDVSELSIEAQDSAPLPRVAGPAKDFVRGSINNRPFRPGGFEDSQNIDRILPDGVTKSEWIREVLNGGPAQTVAPSLKQGLDLGDLKAYPSTWNVYNDESSLNNRSDKKLSELSVQFDDLFKKAWEEDAVAAYEGDGMFICSAYLVRDQFCSQMPSIRSFLGQAIKLTRSRLIDWTSAREWAILRSVVCSRFQHLVVEGLKNCRSC